MFWRYCQLYWKGRGGFFIGNSVPHVWSSWFFYRCFYWLMNCQNKIGCWLLVILILIKCCLSMFFKVDPLIKIFYLSQSSQYSTHVHRGRLDLVFDTSNSNTASYLLSTYIDHFVLFFQIWWIILIQNLRSRYITHK